MIKKLILLSFVLLMALTGCAKGTGHLYIKKNGNMDLHFDMLLNSRAKMFLDSTFEEKIKKQFTENGFEFERMTDGENLKYHAEKHINSFKTKEDKLQTFSVKVTSGFFYTKYEVNGEIDPSTYIEGTLNRIDSKNIPKNLFDLFLEKMDFDFKVTLPIDSIGKYNADRKEGKTLSWNISLTEATPIYFDFTVPNIKNISILIVGILIVLVITFGVWYMKRKNKKLGE
ncbi:hypothetical protein [Bacillus sp. 03113]|uniref:hypothetical protein n=1 Tax=Bacillus sp. 03113 TaxID=2578211 RepID=UPI001144352A|nr:hypothetical protein [Bacillus sp. 03113]